MDDSILDGSGERASIGWWVSKWLISDLPKGLLSHFADFTLPTLFISFFVLRYFAIFALTPFVPAHFLVDYLVSYQYAKSLCFGT
jgi:hypothetical protein